MHMTMMTGCTYLVEKFLVAVEQSDQVDVFVEVVVKATYVVHNSCFLLVAITHVGRQQAVNAKDLTFFQCKRHALQPHNTNYLLTTGLTTR